MSSDSEDWRANRRAAAEEHQAALERQHRAEHVKAAALLADFVRQATEGGLPTELLRAKPYDGHGSYRTTVQGWYLRLDHSIAVGTDGGYYVLRVPRSLSGRWRPVPIEPTDPPLVVGAGGRDGESIDLAELLQMRLTDWPAQP